MRIGCQIGMWKTEDLEAAARAIGEVGARGVEIFTTHFEPYRDDPGGLKALLDAAGLALSGAYFNSKDFLSADAADAVAAQAARDSEFLAAVGGEFLLLNGGVSKSDEERTFTREEFRHLAGLFNRIASEAGERGIGVAMHPHANCMIETPEDVDRLVAAGLDRRAVGLCVHASHQLGIGADPYAIYGKHADRVRYVHCGDADESGKGELFGRGVLDQKRLMRPLLDAGYDGWIVIECGKAGVSPAEYATEAIAYMKETWPEIAWEA